MSILQEHIDLIIFIILQFVLVVVSTFKSIILIKGSKHTASIVSSVSYTVNAVIVKAITKQPFTTIIITVFLANLFGTYIAMWILDKISKDKVWYYLVTLVKKNDMNIEKELESNLSKYNLKYTIQEAFNDRTVFNIFAENKEESIFIKDILKKYNVKYSIIETVN